MPQKKAVIFDINSLFFKEVPKLKIETEEAFIGAISRKFDISDKVARHQFRAKEKEIEDLLSYSSGIQVMKSFGFSWDEIFSFFVGFDMKYLKTDKKLRELIELLEKRCTFYLLSDYPISLLVKILRKLRLKKTFFKDAVTIDMSRTPRSHNLMLRLLMERNHMDPKTTYLIGTSEHLDIIPAKSLGIRAILMSEKKVKSKSDHRIKELSEINRIMSKRDGK